MGVLSTVIPEAQESHLAIELLQHGLEHTAEVVERDNGRVYVDIVGEPYKTLHAALRAGARPLAYVPKVRFTRK